MISFMAPACLHGCVGSVSARPNPVQEKGVPSFDCSGPAVQEKSKGDVSAARVIALHASCASPS